jgi:hypothetical protein
MLLRTELSQLLGCWELAVLGMVDWYALVKVLGRLPPKR